MSHLKRISIPRSWPLPRKGTKYLLCAHPGKKAEISIPLGIIIRDVLKIANTKKEMKALLQAEEIEVDGKIVREEKFPISIFDIIGVKSLNKSFKVILNEKGKLDLEETKETTKVCKVIGKKMLPNKVLQINCFDGRNFISKEKISVNDSLQIDIKTGKIIKILPFKTGSEVFITGGEHIGQKGKISEAGRQIRVSIKGKNFEIHAKNIYVI